jgi:hypothetical protein
VLKLAAPTTSKACPEQAANGGMTQRLESNFEQVNGLMQTKPESKEI